MTVVADKALLRARFDAEFDTDAVQTVYDNAPNESVDLTRPFVRFGINAEDAIRESFGTGGIHANHGSVWLQVVVPNGVGDNPADEIVDQFVSVFRNWRADSDDLFCGTEIIRPVADKSAYVVNVRIPYTSNR